ILAANVDVSGVVPALGGVFEEVDGADGERLALNNNVSAARSQYSSWYEAQSLEGTARTKRARARRRVVNQVSALQMEATRSQILDFNYGVICESFMDLCIPLLNVLSWSVRIKSGETHCCGRQRAFAKDGSAEVERVRE